MGLPGFVDSGNRVLVTGGSGFIAGHFTRRFDELGISYNIIDLFPPNDDQRPHTFVRGDVRDEEAVRHAIAGCDAVLHLAAAHHDSGISDQTYFQVNLDATDRLYRIAVDERVRHFCFFSSAAVYGAAETVRDESSKPAPIGPYGSSKLAAEEKIRQLHPSSQLPTLIVRPSVTFGPGNYANMYSLIRQIDSGRFMQVGRGENIKSLSYVENLVEFTLFAWPRVKSGIETYNWVESPDRTSREIVRALSELLGRSLLPISVPLSLAELAAAVIERAYKLAGATTAISAARVRKLASEQTFFSAKLAREIGFEPMVSLADGLARTVAWYSSTGRHGEIVRRLPPPDIQILSRG